MLPASITTSMIAQTRLTALLAAALGVASLALMSAAAPAAGAPAAPPPNIVFIMTDDQIQGSLGVMHNVQTQIKAQGTEFSQTIASFPLCCPSRATYLTGQYPHNHGVKHNIPPFGGYIGLDHMNTLPVWLQNAGYRTMHLGRYLNGYGTQNPDVTDIPPGWNEWHSMVDPSTFDLTRWQMNDNGVITNQPAERPGEYQTDFLGRRAVELIEAAAPSPQPFFLSLTPPAPHSSRPIDPDDPPRLRTPSPAPRHRDAFAGTPLPRPPNFNEANMRDKPQVVADRTRIPPHGINSIQENYQQTLEALLSVDEAVGAILQALERTGELQNTLVVYTADNGFFYGEHRVRSEKVLPYEPGIRVPLVMRGPGVPRGERRSQLVSNVDWAPTILDAAGATPGRVQDGRSLFELLRDPTLQLGREIELENGNGANKIPSYRGIRNDRFLFVRHDTTGEQELYDLRKDPFELQSLDEAEEYDRIRRLLARRLRVLDDCTGASCGSSRPAVRLRLRELVPAAKRKNRGSSRGSSRRSPAAYRVRRVRRCLERDLRVGIYGRERKLVQRVRYFGGAKILGSTARAPFSLDAKRRALPTRRRAVRIRARITTRDGRIVTRDRMLRTCPRRR